MHAKEYEQMLRERYPDRRASSSERGYGVEWSKVRNAYLADHPWCAHCAIAGQRIKATDVDHIKPRRDGGTDDAENLQSLCHRHHSLKTARHDGGSWHAHKLARQQQP
jgi:5-methylcytosine-specific restriction protein A